MPSATISPGTYAAICFVILVSVCVFVLMERLERWLRPGDLTAPAGAPRRDCLRPVTALRIVIIVAVLAAWEALAASGLLYRDVVPSLARDRARALCDA